MVIPNKKNFKYNFPFDFLFVLELNNALAIARKYNNYLKKTKL